MKDSKPPQIEQEQKEGQEKQLSFLERNKKMGNILLGFSKIVSEEELIEVQNELVTHVLHIKGKYGDYKQYRVFHILAGSTPKPNLPIIEDDFPGEDSAEVFLDNLAKKHNILG